MKTLSIGMVWLVMTLAAVAGIGYGGGIIIPGPSSIPAAGVNINGQPAQSQLLQINSIIANAVKGTTNGYIFCLGDSTTGGYKGGGNNSINEAVNAYPYWLGKLSTNFNFDSWLGRRGGNGTGTDTDPRILQVGGFNAFNGPSELTAQGWWNYINNSNAFVFQTTCPANFCKVIFNKTSDSGWANIYTNGVLYQAVNLAGSYPKESAIVHVPLPLNATNQISINATNSDTTHRVEINGMLFGISNSTVSIVNCGFEGYTTTLLQQICTNSFMPAGNFMTQKAPFLGNSAAIISIGINDADAQLDLATWGGQFTTLCNELIVESCPVSVLRNTPSTTTYACIGYPDKISTNGYAAFEYNYCLTNSIPFLNLENFWSTNAPNTFLAGDNTHLSSLGYWEVARFIFKCLY